MYASPTTHAAAFNAVMTMIERSTPQPTKELNYVPFGAAVTDYAPVSDRRKRRTAKAQERKTTEPTLPIWCKVVLAIKAIIKRCKVSQLYSPFTYFSLLGTMRTTTLIAKIHRKMAHVMVQCAIQTTLQQLAVPALPAWCETDSKKHIKRMTRELADRTNGGGTRHENACNGKSGNFTSYSRSIAEQGKQTYLHGLPPHAVGM